VREKELEASFERVAGTLMATYDLFIHRGNKVQNEWLVFIRRLDAALAKALKQTVKNTLLDLGKHICGDAQRQELVPIFRVYTKISDDANPHGASAWKIMHDPSHEHLKETIRKFMRQIIHVTRVVPRVEKVFRERRDAKIAGIWRELVESEKSGGNPAAAFAKAGMRQDANWANLTEEEKDG
jgi:hypothetical protein